MFALAQSVVAKFLPAEGPLKGRGVLGGESKLFPMISLWSNTDGCHCFARTFSVESGQINVLCS